MSATTPRLFLNRILVLLVASSLLACGGPGTRERRPVQFTEVPRPHSGEPFPNWPFPPHRVETEGAEAIAAGRVEFVEAEGTGRGTTGASKVTLFFPGVQSEVAFKWKEAPGGDLDGFNNSPRRELAAYQIQRLFLDHEDYVVPTSLMTCPPVDRYAKHFGPTTATVEGTNCVLGVLSIWLKDVTIPEPLFEEERFLQDPTYAYFLSNLNLLTYLIAHRDARKGNFLVSRDDRRRQAFSIDNGESFGSFPYNFFVQNWDVILVPALRRESVDRLREVSREDLDFLGVVAQLEADESGTLQPVAPGDNLDPDKGVRVRGGTVQFGLRNSEIDDVWKRIQQLIADVDAGKMPVF